MIVPVDVPDDLLQRVEAAAREEGMPFREFVAAALQAAVTARGKRSAGSRGFSQRVHDFGTHLESPWTVLAELETDEYGSTNSRKEK